jgi:hypothetical protein
MRSIPTLVLVAAGALVIGAHASAQSTPNFSGTWVLSPESAPKAGGTRPGTGTGTSRSDTNTSLDRLGGGLTCDTECTITQTAKAITIKRPANAQGVTSPVVLLNLDGSDSKNQQPGGSGGPPTDYVAHAKWSGNMLVVTRAFDERGQVVMTQTLSLAGGKLTIAHSINLEVTGLPMLIYTKK